MMKGFSEEARLPSKYGKEVTVMVIVHLQYFKTQSHCFLGNLIFIRLRRTSSKSFETQTANLQMGSQSPTGSRTSRDVK